jgi:CRISPR-associated protein Csb2
MTRALLLSAHFNDGRFHGSAEWPPSPARLFQALVAGAIQCSALPPDYAAALRWLECLSAPAIAVPSALAMRGLTTYVPNNDLDAVGGHPSRAAKIRVGKTIKPRLFDASIPLLYAWTFSADAESLGHAINLCAIADRLYQLGRGVDMAWAVASVLDVSAATQRLADHLGPVHRPAEAGMDGQSLPCPLPGSLDSIVTRHTAQSKRFGGGTRKGATVFVQPPKARFRMIRYDCPPVRFLFEIRNESAFAPWPLRRATALVERLRDQAGARLQEALPQRAGEIERLLIGRGAAAADIVRRPRILPLPSIGSIHADEAIRRVLVEVPPDCPIHPDDLGWAFSGLPTDIDGSTGEILSNTRLVPADEDGMLRHFGLAPARPARCWRTVTPVVLPYTPRTVARRSGSSQAMYELAAIDAVRLALRHAGELTRTLAIGVQREPFSGNGQRAEVFADGTRFVPERLHHVELRFATPRDGLLVLGDGRWLGLGLMAPMGELPGVLGLQVIKGLAAGAMPADIADALRRAVMARVQDRIGRAPLPPFFTGHTADGTPLRGGGHAHLAFAYDPTVQRLLIIAPHMFEGREATREELRHLATLDAALATFRDLRAGSAGRLSLAPAEALPATDPVLAVARSWVSVTPLVPTRHAKELAPVRVIQDDIFRECRRRNWPEPKLLDITVHEGPRGGLAAMARLWFAVARSGPILLGRTAHQGGGLFRGAA